MPTDIYNACAKVSNLPFAAIMYNMDTCIRNYHTEDREALVRFWMDLVKIEESHERSLVRELTGNLDRPNHFPGKNLFIAENMGNIIGHIDVFPETDIGRVVVQCLVHPGHRRRGIAERLVERAIERAIELKVKIAHANISQDDKAGKRLFSKMGFRFVRRYLELGLDLSKVRLSKIKRNDYLCRPMNPGEEEKLTRLQNRSFMDTWGFNPNTLEDIRYRIHLSAASFEDITLCLDETEPIGYCWSMIYDDNDNVLDGTRGRINMLGVDPDYRGKGVGKKVLLNGLVQLKGRGVRVVVLTVDNENKAARSLYQSVGFKVQSSSLWYQKDL
jgi:mycothiol synthase